MASVSLFFCLFTSVLFSCSVAIAPSPSPSPPLAPYIRRSCHRTLYPGLCYASLSPYADQIKTDPVLLARFAMNVTITHLKPIAIRIATSTRSRAALAPGSRSSNGSTGKLKDCTGLVTGAMSWVKKSEKEVAGLESKVGPEVAWRISNAQTWLSAAITDEETCIDEFGLGDFGDGDGGGGMKEDVEVVCRKLRRAEHLTSNALALINSLVNS